MTQIYPKLTGGRQILSDSRGNYEVAAIYYVAAAK